MNFYKENLSKLKSEAENLLPQFRDIYHSNGPLQLIQMIHDDVQAAIDRSGLMEQASCTGSCSFCCHDKIMMGSLEADYTRHLLKLNNVKGNKRRIKLQSLNQPIKWIDQACPYLSDENEKGERKCSIYKIRPLVCRAHNSKEDPKFCNKDNYPDRFINEGRIISVEAAQIALMLLQGELENKEEVEMIAIHKLKI